MDELSLLPQELMCALLGLLDVESLFSLFCTNKGAHTMKELLGQDVWNNKAKDLVTFSPLLPCSTADVLMLNRTKNNILNVRYEWFRTSSVAEPFCSVHNGLYFSEGKIRTFPDNDPHELRYIPKHKITGRNERATMTNISCLSWSSDDSPTAVLANNKSLKTIDVFDIEFKYPTESAHSFFSSTIVGDIIFDRLRRVHFNVRTKKVTQWSHKIEVPKYGEDAETGWCSIGFLPLGIVFRKGKRWKLVAWEGMTDLDEDHLVYEYEYYCVCPTFVCTPLFRMKG